MATMETTDRDVPMQTKKNEALSSSLPHGGSACLTVQLFDALPEFVTNSSTVDCAADIRLAGPALFGDFALRETEGLQVAQHFLDGHSHSTNQVMYER